MATLKMKTDDKWVSEQELKTVLLSTHGKAVKWWKMTHTVQDTFCIRHTESKNAIYCHNSTNVLGILEQ